ncbi:MAG: Glu/Leu/Phe/Val dehydrogenase [Chloroflexi bacterium]|nr:Glu/Leu/Phe/Val dehydrogenase [Chloroflexota bacterium]
MTTDSSIFETDLSILRRMLGPPREADGEFVRWVNVELQDGTGGAAVAEAYDTLHHEEVLYHRDAASGLRTIIAIHSTALGPALGGTRWYPYDDAEAALRDVLRLSMAMTAKSAVAGLDLGGGKAAVIGEPAERTPEQLAAYARAVNHLEGRYITTTDVGTTTADLDQLAEFTDHIVGTSPERGGSGDTSALTAETVMLGMRAALRVAFGDESLEGRRVVVVGVGKVGGRVARACAAGGASVGVADVWREGAERLAAEIGADVLDPATAYTEPCDVLSPNALGGVLNEQSIPELRCRVICGAANNQLLRDPEDAELLDEHGILYAPDYVVSAGGVINVAVELDGYSEERARAIAGRVYPTTLEILELSERLVISTAEAALRRVEDRIAAQVV